MSGKHPARAVGSGSPWPDVCVSCAVAQDHDDDGESGAGRNLSRLLSTMKAQNVVGGACACHTVLLVPPLMRNDLFAGVQLVVVTRWYGGVHLGPDRFRHINNLARQIVESGGFARTDDVVGGRSEKAAVVQAPRGSAACAGRQRKPRQDLTSRPGLGDVQACMSVPSSSRGCSATLAVRVRPNANRGTQFTGVDAAAKEVLVDVAARASDGKANKALLAFIAAAAGVPKTSVMLFSGHKARNKVVGFVGDATVPMLAPRLAQAIADSYS